MADNEQWSRSTALLGEDAMRLLARSSAMIVGIGGVGSWCAEALVRTGLGKIVLIDNDVVATSNLNRQCPATIENLGRKKVEAMKDRLMEINPECEIIARAERYMGEQIASINEVSVVVDAIDSVDCKAKLILNAFEAKIPIVSSMGAALRTDPTKIRMTEFAKVEGDGLARALRQRFKRMEKFPGKFKAVWSSEAPQNDLGVRGSLMMVTATFGMCLAKEAVECIIK